MSRDTERGSLSLESLIVAPALLMLMVLVLLGGRVGLATVAVDAAAQNAARAASVERTPAAARQAAVAKMTATLEHHGLECSPRSEELDVADVGKQPGDPGAVHVTVTCTVPFSPVPGSARVTGRGDSSVDTYRQNGQ